ncbi:protein-export chaperone SecB [Kineothrix sedimenti]|uniref:Protein-export chaperone SecB n=1 Tax=Kineothrix sedimenti TaxID=3123317 RepID=A0ABZ3ESB3_9FIRM
MEKNIKSSLTFQNYVVDYLEFKNNVEFNGEEVKVDFEIAPDFEINEDKTEMIVILNLVIFRDAENLNLPFEMSLRVFGVFSMNVEDENIERYKRNAVAILYPYIRAIVTNYTANANVNPLMLPTINVNKLIDIKEENKKKQN